jgi:hypothetical protein
VDDCSGEPQAFFLNQVSMAVIIHFLLNIYGLQVLVGIFSCSPVEGFWNLEISSTCIEEYDFFLSNECLTIALDIVVLLMPIYYISHIKRSLAERISISSTFALGLMLVNQIPSLNSMNTNKSVQRATIISAIRLWQLVVAQQRPGFDPTCKHQKPFSPFLPFLLSPYILKRAIYFYFFPKLTLKSVFSTPPKNSQPNGRSNMGNY